MKKINSPKFWHGIEKARKIRYICIGVVVLIGIFLIIGGFFESKRDVGTPNDMGAISDLKIDEFVYIDVTTVPYLFAENDTNKLYFVWDADNRMYIVDLIARMAKKLEAASENNPIKIIGTTKEITTEIKNLAIRVYNQNKDEGSENLTYANFNDFLGMTYLDAKEDMTNKIIYYSIGGIFLIFALAFGIIHFFTERKINKVIKKLTQEEADLIAKEVENDNTIVYDKVHLFLTENYIINLGKSLEFTKYSDITWVYFTDIKQNGVLSARHINLITDEFKDRWIPIIPYGKTRNAHLEIIDKIAAKNPDALIGYTPENIKIMKDGQKVFKKVK